MRVKGVTFVGGEQWNYDEDVVTNEGDVVTYEGGVVTRRGCH